MMDQEKPIVWFKDVDKDDVGLVGGKGANLGEMAKAGFLLPPGFIVTSGAYFDFLESNNFPLQIKRILEPCNIQDPPQLNEASARIKALIKRGKIPDKLAKLIIQYYEKLGGLLRSCLVAVRSSATAEDLPDASFAGQQETFLNIKGEANVVNKVRECWAYLPPGLFFTGKKKSLTILR
jgi:pyruvate,water dikinase